MSDIELARQAAARAQSSIDVASGIIAGRYDEWPNVLGALNAIKLARGESLPPRAQPRV